MKKSSWLSLTIIMVVILGIVLTSCKKDEEGDAKLNVSFVMKTTSTSTQKAANTLEFTSGYVTIREIVFDGDIKDGESVSITHEQVSTINLVTGVASPVVELIIPMGEYTSVNLGIELQDVDATPSVIAEGTYTDGSEAEIPVKFEFNSGEVFEANAEGHTFEAESSAIAEIDFSPAVWFSTITGTMLDEAEKVDGVILINESYNSGIFDIVADKLDDATQAEFK